MQSITNRAEQATTIRNQIQQAKAKGTLIVSASAYGLTFHTRRPSGAPKKLAINPFKA